MHRSTYGFIRRGVTKGYKELAVMDRRSLLG
jgi:hypothetical protein